MPSLCRFVAISSAVAEGTASVPCRRRARYGPDPRHPLYCALHRGSDSQVSVPCCVRCVCGLRRPLYNLVGESRPLFCALCRPTHVETVNVLYKARTATATAAPDSIITASSVSSVSSASSFTPPSALFPLGPVQGKVDRRVVATEVIHRKRKEGRKGMSLRSKLPRIRLCKSLQLFPDRPCFHPAHEAQAYRGYCAPCFHRLFPYDSWTIQQENNHHPATAIVRFLECAIDPIVFGTSPEMSGGGGGGGGGEAGRKKKKQSGRARCRDERGGRGNTGLNKRMPLWSSYEGQALSPWFVFDKDAKEEEDRNETSGRRFASHLPIGFRYWVTGPERDGDVHVLDLLFLKEASRRVLQTTAREFVQRPACKDFFRKRARQRRENKSWQSVKSCTTILVGLAAYDHPSHPDRIQNPQLFTRLDRLCHTVQQWHKHVGIRLTPPSLPPPPPIDSVLPIPLTEDEYVPMFDTHEIYGALFLTSAATPSASA